VIKHSAVLDLIRGADTQTDRAIFTSAQRYDIKPENEDLLRGKQPLPPPLSLSIENLSISAVERNNKFIDGIN